MLGDPRSPITILGTGAMALLFGANLARAGARVTLVGTWGAAITAVARDGIAVDSGNTVWTVPARAVPLGAPLPAAPLVLVLVKAHRTAEVASEAALLVTEDGLVLTLQNGMGNRETLAAVVGEARVAVGVTSVGARVLGPGFVRAAGGGETILGYDEPTRRPVESVARRMRAAGFVVTTSVDIDALIWRKLAVNCAINPLTALHAVPNGTLLSDRRLSADMDAAAGEVAAVAEAAGVRLGADVRALAKEVAARTGENRSSMLQDIERGVATEIDAISGAVVRIGKELGVPTPVNERLWRRVMALQGDEVPDSRAAPS